MALVLCLWALLPVGAFAAASLPGRGWTATEQFVPARSRYAAGSLFTHGPGGTLMLVGSLQPDTSAQTLLRWATFVWDSSRWVDVDRTTWPKTSLPWPSYSLDSLDHLVWIAPDPRLDGVLLHAAMDEGRFLAPVDTLALTLQLDQEFSSAFDRDGHGWVIRSEWRQPASLGLRIRVFHRHLSQPWRELSSLGANEDHCAVAPAGADSALIVYAGQSGLAWALMADTAVVDSGSLDTRPFVAAHPRFHMHPDGSLQLMWTDRAATYSRTRSRAGLWGPTDTLSFLYPPGETFVTAWIDVSREPEYPAAAAWSILGYGLTSREGIAVGVQRDAQWDVFEIPASPPGEIPAVARDRFGDVWVSWSRLGLGGIYFMHSYVRALPSLDPVLGTPHERTVRWRLSEPAPGSTWRVERSTPAGAWEEVARIRAGDDSALAFVDRSFADARLSYRVAVCAEDLRFAPASGVETWEPGPVTPRLLVRGLPTRPEALSFTLYGVPDSEIVVELFDVFGRRMVSRTVRVSSPVEAVVSFPAPAGLPAGLYVLRARARVPLPAARVVLM